VRDGDDGECVMMMMVSACGHDCECVCDGECMWS